MRTTTAPPPLPLRIITHNIRYATASPFPGELLWPQRSQSLLSSLHFLTRPQFTPASTLICLQEVLHSQLSDIQASLTNSSSPHWMHLGVGRDDGKIAGEYAPIFYRADVWEPLHFQTYWLSPTPTVPGSKGWDAASVRIVGAALLRHRETGRRVLAMNTHLDDQGAVSRKRSAELLLRIHYINSVASAVDFSFLAGDLNSEPSGDAYQILNGPGSVFEDMRNWIGREQDGGIKKYGNEMTFTGFDDAGDGEGTTRIDFIHLARKIRKQEDDDSCLARKGEVSVKVEGYSVLPNKFEDGMYMSDHRAVVGDVILT